MGTLHTMLSLSFIHLFIFFLPFAFQSSWPSFHIPVPLTFCRLGWTPCLLPFAIPHALSFLWQPTASSPHIPTRPSPYSSRLKPGSFLFTHAYAPAPWLFTLGKRDHVPTPVSCAQQQEPQINEDLVPPWNGTAPRDKICAAWPGMSLSILRYRSKDDKSIRSTWHITISFNPDNISMKLFIHMLQMKTRKS